MNTNLNDPLKIKFDNTYLQLPIEFYKRALPAKVSDPRLIFYNSKLAEQLNIENSNTETLKLFLSGQALASGSDPIAQAYAGHQFGHFVPQLGDGRAILLGEILDSDQKHWDIQLKGAGLTPFSRGGDGLAPLGAMIREYIISEAMNALGIPTTRALALVTTGDPVYREKTLPGAILTRIASSHIRVGTFEYFASRNDYKNLKILSDYTINRHYPECTHFENPYLELLKAVITAQAKLIACWMGVGFIHGVMNTDNMTISGETIDYGPCAFMDFYDPNKVYSSIDRGGRYAYKNQTLIAEWNLSVFASCLLPLISNPLNEAFESSDNFLDKQNIYTDQNIKVVQDEIDKFKSKYRYFWLQIMRQKLGFIKTNHELNIPTTFTFEPIDESDLNLIQNFLDLLSQQHIDYTIGFRALSELVDSNPENSRLVSMFNPKEEILIWIKKWKDRLKHNLKSNFDVAKSMNSRNPVFIPRNHWIDKAIKEAELRNDFSLSETLLSLVTQPFENAKDEDIQFTYPPKPEEQITKTFCGT